MESKRNPKILLVANVAKEHVLKFHIPTISMLKNYGWQVDVACKMDAPIPCCDHTFNLSVERNPFHFKTVKAIAELRRIIRENGYDIVYCHTVTGSLVARLAAKPFRKDGVKVIYLAHGFYFYHGASLKKWIIGYPMERILSEFTDVLITINKEDYAFATRHFHKPQIQRIDGIGVDLNKYKIDFSDEQKKRYREELGCTMSDYVGIYVAELTKLKNQSSLIKAVKLIQKSIPEFKLLLVGPDHLNGLLAEEADDLPIGSVIFTGWRSDVCQLLRSADIALASSTSEGLGLNIIEAMACGLPVVAYDNRGHREIISDRINGRLIPLNDCSELAKAVAELRISPEKVKRFTQNASESITRFDTDNVLRELYEILESSEYSVTDC